MRTARAAETPTSPASANQSRQRLGNANRCRPPRRRPIRLLAPRPSGWPQRAQIIRPAKPRSAFTAQLPQFGQAMRGHTLGNPPHGDTPLASHIQAYTSTMTQDHERDGASGPARQASGFPSPAADYEESRIDLNRELIPSPLSTFLMRVRGEAMRGDGIHDGDLLVIDRALTPRPGCVVVAVHEGHFIVRRLCLGPGNRLPPRLEASDGMSPPIALDKGQGGGADLWGVVTQAVRSLIPQTRPGATRGLWLREQEGGRRGS